MKISILLCSLLLLGGCATYQRQQSEPESDPVSPRPGAPRSGQIDLSSLQERLKMTRPIENLGFEEKPFSNCPPGQSTTQACEEMAFTVVHFQLLCRQSEGTVSNVSKSELSPLVSNNVTWKIGSLSGSTSTNSKGYGSIRLVSRGSNKGKKLILQSGPQYLGLGVSEVTKIVIPWSWCAEA